MADPIQQIIDRLERIQFLQIVEIEDDVSDALTLARSLQQTSVQEQSLMAAAEHHKHRADDCGRLARDVIALLSEKEQ